MRRRSAPQSRSRCILDVTAEPMLAPPIGVAARAAVTLEHSQLGDALYVAAKRALDVLVATTLLIALLPLFAIVGLAICMESGRPIFYRGERVGRLGRSFTVVKFRSMRPKADETPHIVFIRSLMRDGATPCELYKVAKDPRITRLGGFLRRTSIDELPQLWNVLRGEMSLVGPRPDVPYAVADYPDRLYGRLLVKPGITGLWQVSGRSRLSLQDMYRLDLDYVAEASLALDLRILARTVPAVLSRDGAA
ncbi:MAG: sugar transferase [Chloroflexi bacterium]|nr:MAG: sugar transferase [Chloroflexota bacterium]TMG72134.1 MAG: sugar transferase [Chloroflexota bacterium]